MESWALPHPCNRIVDGLLWLLPVLLHHLGKLSGVPLIPLPFQLIYTAALVTDAVCPLH